MLKFIFVLLLLPISRLWQNTNKSWILCNITLITTNILIIVKFIPQTHGTTTYLSTFFTLDSLSLPLILLTLWTSTLILLARINILKNGQAPNIFYWNIVFLTLILVLVFCISNLLLFYIFFEASLIPTLFLVLRWGYQPERLQAGIYLIIYTLIASLPLLISILIIINKNNSLFIFSKFITSPTTHFISLWWFISIIAFIVKIPLYTTHLWLPKAHVEAPVAGSIILAGVLLKLGGYGIIRFASPFWWVSTSSLSNKLFTSIRILGAIITGIICLRQPDIKALIAYSSVGHIGLVIAGFISGSPWGWEACLTIIVAHGLCSSALFALANITYETTHSRSMLLNKGLLSLFPIITIWWFILRAANIGAPPSLNLVREVRLFARILSLSKWFLPFIVLSTFISGLYSLILYTSTQHGSCSNYINPLNLFINRNNLIIVIHTIPLFILILKIDLLISWL